MKLRLRGDWRTFENLLDEIDAPTRTIQLVTQQLIRRAGRGAKTAVNALTKDGVGLLAVRRVSDEVSKVGLHGRPRSQRSLYIRPRLKMPCGSNTAFRLRWTFAMAGDSGVNTPTALLPFL